MIGSVRSSPSPRAASRIEPLSDALLAMSIILAGASGFRIGGIPVGPGEACLLAWIGFRTLQEIFSKQSRVPPGEVDTGPSRERAAERSPRAGPGSSPVSPPLCALAGFWGVFATAQCLGLLMSMACGDPIEWPIVLHDIVAFTLMALLGALCLSLPDASFRLARITRYAMMFGCLSLTLQVASAWDLFAVPGIEPWYWDRFRGWADNPNQLSLFCAVLVPVALFGAEVSKGRSDRFAAVVCAAAALTAGVLTKGNSLRLALAIGLGCSILIIVGRVLSPGRAVRTRRQLPLALVVVSAPLMLMAGLPFVATFKAEDIAQQVSRDSAETMSEAALRFELWNGAFGQGLRSLYLGLGPGPHAHVPLAIAVRQRWEPGADDPSLGDVAKHGAVMESHNSYVELFSQGGILIILAYVGLLAYAMRQSMVSRSVALPALVCVIASFGFFHVVLRHPIVWFGLCLCLATTAPPVSCTGTGCRDRGR